MPVWRSELAPGEKPGAAGALAAEPAASAIPVQIPRTVCLYFICLRLVSAILTVRFNPSSRHWHWPCSSRRELSLVAPEKRTHFVLDRCPTFLY